MGVHIADTISFGKEYHKIRGQLASRIDPLIYFSSKKNFRLFNNLPWSLFVWLTYLSVGVLFKQCPKCGETITKFPLTVCNFTVSGNSIWLGYPVAIYSKIIPRPKQSADAADCKNLTFTTVSELLVWRSVFCSSFTASKFSC